MLEILKTVFDTDASTISYNLRHAKPDLDRDTVEAAMQAIVESGALEGVIGANKAVRLTSESETIYEA